MTVTTTDPWERRVADAIAAHFEPDHLFNRNAVCEAMGLGYHESDDPDIERQRVNVHRAVYRLSQTGKIRHVVDVRRRRLGKDHVRYLRA